MGKLFLSIRELIFVQYRSFSGNFAIPFFLSCLFKNVTSHQLPIVELLFGWSFFDVDKETRLWWCSCGGRYQNVEKWNSIIFNKGIFQYFSHKFIWWQTTVTSIAILIELSWIDWLYQKPQNCWLMATDYGRLHNWVHPLCVRYHQTNAVAAIVLPEMSAYPM